MHQPQQQQQQAQYISSPAAASSSSTFQPTRQLQSAASASASASAGASAYPAGLRSDADIPYATEHEESCICTVCSCGKHACPPTPRLNHYDPAIASESRQAFQGVFVPAKRAGAPTTYKERNVPFEGESTSKADYKNHGVVARRSGPPRSAATMDGRPAAAAAPFDDTTTNKSDYPAHPILPRSAGGPRDGNLTTLGPDDRDFSTEGRGQFVPHALQARASRPVEALRPSLPFSGTSTQHADFAAYANARPSVPKFRAGGFQPSPEDRDFTTEGRQQFDRKYIAPCPAIPVAVATKQKPGHVLVEETAPGTGAYKRKV